MTLLAAMESHLSDFKPRPPAGVSKNAILSFDRYKAIYILVLVGFHQHLLGNPQHNIQPSARLPYQTVDHGVELMMGMLLITGWLSSATWKEATWKDHMKKKVSRLIPPYIMALFLTAFPVALQCREWTCYLQFALECTTLAGWNPALMWWTKNRPLWFMSTILTYHYISPFFLRWIRKQSTKSLVLSLLGLYLMRTGLALVALFSLQRIFGDLQRGRIIHCWSPLQVWIPAMGAILEQLAQRLRVPTWVKKAHLWIATDALFLIVLALTVFIPRSRHEMLDRMVEYNNLLTAFPLMLLITLLSCDCNSFRFVTSATAGLRTFFANLLSVSYTMFLTHWPLDILFSMMGIFREDSWDAVLGCWSLEVCIALFLDSVIMGSFTRSFIRWLQGPSDAKPTSVPLVGPAQGGASHVAEVPELTAVPTAAEVTDACPSS